MPPPQTDMARIAELWEGLHNLHPPLVRELLFLLRRCDMATLAKIFEVSVATPPAPAAEAAQELASAGAPEVPNAAEASVAPSPPVTGYAAEVARLRADFDAARWDATGKRLNPSPSVFPRYREPPGRRPGTSWMSD